MCYTDQGSLNYHVWFNIHTYFHCRKFHTNSRVYILVLLSDVHCMWYNAAICSILPSGNHTPSILGVCMGGTTVVVPKNTSQVNNSLCHSLWMRWASGHFLLTMSATAVTALRSPAKDLGWSQIKWELPCSLLYSFLPLTNLIRILWQYQPMIQYFFLQAHNLAHKKLNFSQHFQIFEVLSYKNF